MRSCAAAAVAATDLTLDRAAAVYAEDPDATLVLIEAACRIGRSTGVVFFHHSPGRGCGLVAARRRWSVRRRSRRPAQRGPKGAVLCGPGWLTSTLPGQPTLGVSGT